jgi:hypothetical protein
MTDMPCRPCMHSDAHGPGGCPGCQTRPPGPCAEARPHLRDGRHLPDTDVTIDVHASLDEGQYRHIHALLGIPAGWFKGWADYFTWPVPPRRVEQITGYLQQIGVAYDIDTTRRWTPTPQPVRDM